MSGCAVFRSLSSSQQYTAQEQHSNSSWYKQTPTSTATFVCPLYTAVCTSTRLFPLGRLARMTRAKTVRFLSIYRLKCYFHRVLLLRWCRGHDKDRQSHKTRAPSRFPPSGFALRKTTGSSGHRIHADFFFFFSHCVPETITSNRNVFLLRVIETFFFLYCRSCRASRVMAPHAACHAARVSYDSAVLHEYIQLGALCTSDIGHYR